MALPGVDPLVVLEVGLHRERPAAGGTDEGTGAAGVSTQLVPLHLTWLLEAQTAVLACEWSLVRVLSFVRHQVVSLWKHFPTRLAAKL